MSNFIFLFLQALGFIVAICGREKHSSLFEVHFSILATFWKHTWASRTKYVKLSCANRERIQPVFRTSNI